MRASSEEVRRYLSERVAPAKAKIGSWWKENNKRYPEIAKVAAIYISVPATQISSESTFSTAGNIDTPYRSRLLTEHIEQLCFIHENSKNKQYRRYI